MSFVHDYLEICIYASSDKRISFYTHKKGVYCRIRIMYYNVRHMCMCDTTLSLLDRLLQSWLDMVHVCVCVCLFCLNYIALVFSISVFILCVYILSKEA